MIHQKIFQSLTNSDRLELLVISRSLVFIFSALALWKKGLSAIDVRNITDYGLVSALPYTFFVALGLLTFSFCLVVHQQQASKPLLFLHVITLITIIHGTLPLVYEWPRYAWTYKHIGLVEHFQRTGSVDLSSDDAYYNWPGFFILSAFVTEIAGFESAIDFAIWAQLFFNLLYLGAILLIYKSSTNDQRLIWLSVWFFCLTNWVGQDYFSPQGLSYFLYLVILGVCLTWFRMTPSLVSIVQHRLVLRPIASLLQRIIRRATLSFMLEADSQSVQRMSLMITILLIFVVITTSHQLTPVMTIGVVAALVIFQCCNARSLPVLMSIITIAWISYVAAPFVASHSAVFTQPFGRLFENLDHNIVDLSHVSQGRAFVAMTCRGLTVLLWFLALLGGIRRLYNGYNDLPIALLALAPFPMLGLQSYGGEMLFRIYLFSLPAMAFFAAAVVYPSVQLGTTYRTLIVTALLSGTMLSSLLFAYYGNERMNRITKNDINAVLYVYNNAPIGSLILTISPNAPTDFHDYGHYIFHPITYLPEFYGRNLVASDIEGIVNLMERKEYPSTYFMITQSQKAHVDLLKAVPNGSTDDLEQALMRSERFKVIFSNTDAKIFVLANNRDGVGR